MNSGERMRDNVAAIYDLILEKLGITYQNWGLEGPLNVPMTPVALAALYPPSENLDYQVILLDTESLKDPELQAGKLRSRILGYKLRAAVLEDQREQADSWQEQSELSQDLIITLLGEEARLYQVPLIFICFSRTVEKGELAAHIYHPHKLPTAVCLQLLQDCIRLAMHKRN